MRLQAVLFACYQLLSLLLLPLALPVLCVALLSGKYRARIPARLGFGLKEKLPAEGTQTVWIHALSVGEVTSAVPLVRGLHERWPAAHLVLSVSTKSGAAVAQEKFADFCTVIAAPFDLWPVTRHFLKRIRPDLFIQVETDFWPGWLHALKSAGVPAYLVNGRITARSFSRYQRFAVFFAPMFSCFSGLVMQTRADADNMRQLGLAPEKIHVLGNLKFDAAGLQAAQLDELTRRALRQNYGFSADALLLVCASTHPGEEAALFTALAALLPDLPALQVLLAPRDIGRAGELAALVAARHGLRFRLRSVEKLEEVQPGPFLLLDTLGELADCCGMADLVFVGGSLAPFGGHNPVEAASRGIAVCFGPHMEDFSEIAAELTAAGGAVWLESDAEMLENALRRLLTGTEQRKRMGQAGLAWVQSRRGVVTRHLELVARHLG